ncbi:Uncharacterised protein family (UPF0158) [Mesobacillus persicus]|uniref:Uncharacterized protein family (UPF0158) n=1 Tax=Mesobacillus persicus TaxID=930146 RepID=A0A1H8FZS1_9BACI|nr:UPF0158 family protein [Mesobacillus persicus]SEN37202.1 Uncharacterised protein family (UPF0158) [Mesobacillus persicus]
MSKTIANLADIIDGMETAMDGWSHFLSLKTGEVIFIQEGELNKAEEVESYEDLEKWEQEDLEIAFDVVENFEDYLELPSSYDINEYEFMRDFCFLVEDERAKNDLLNAIQGRGAFRRFKDRVAWLGMLDEWYQYRNGRYREIAIEWCEENGVEYREGRVVQGE